MAARKAAQPANTAAARAPRPRKKPPEPPDPLRQVTADEVWAACPPMGEPAQVTRDIADRLGVTHATPVLLMLHRLADVGRVQRLTKTGSNLYRWRRQ